jgi:hypothetical protein
MAAVTESTADDLLLEGGKHIKKADATEEQNTITKGMKNMEDLLDGSILDECDGSMTSLVKPKKSNK